MKKFVPAFIAFVLAFSLVLADLTPAQAATKWGDPTVTPITGDTEFTITLLDPAKIGSYKGDSGLTIPDGFLDGEKQFGGKLLILKGVSLGSESLCYPFPTYQYGWRGFLARWDGAKWVKLATSITPGKESAPAMACTTIYGDGTYGLIVSYSDEDAPACGLELLYVRLGFSGNTTGNQESRSLQVSLPYVLVYEAVIKPNLPDGTAVTYAIQGITPAGFLSGDDLTATGVVIDQQADMSLVVFNSLIYFNPDIQEDPNFSVRISIPGCTKTYSMQEILNLSELP
jgi:hypothetical protein